MGRLSLVSAVRCWAPGVPLRLEKPSSIVRKMLSFLLATGYPWEFPRPLCQLLLPQECPGVGTMHSTQVPTCTPSYRKLGVSTPPPQLTAPTSQSRGNLKHRLALSWWALHLVLRRGSRCIFLEALRLLGNQDFGTFLLIVTTATIMAKADFVLTLGQAPWEALLVLTGSL